MKLKEYAKHIKKIAKEYPDLDVYYAIDDEGNAYHPVFYKPSVQEGEDCDIDKNKIIVIN